MNKSQAGDERELHAKSALVVSGTTSGLAVARSLGSRGVPVVVADWVEHNYAGASRYVRRNLRVSDPRVDEPTFVDSLLGYAKYRPGALLIPGSDEALVALARNKERLQEAFSVACPRWDVVSRVIEKRHTYEIARSVGVPIPRTVFPGSLAEVQRFAGIADYPCLVKPSQSHLFYDTFRCKMFPAFNARELVKSYSRAVDAGLEVILQEFVPGGDHEGVNYNSYRWGDRQVVEFTASKVRNAPPSYGSPRVVLSQRVPGVVGPARLLLDALTLDGFSCVEFKRDPRNGTYVLMEVNARHNLSGSLAIRCGVDFPWIQYRHMVYGEEPTQPVVAEGVYWIDITSDLLHTMKNVRHERLSAKEFVRPYVSRHVFAVASVRDPRPALERLKHHGRAIALRLWQPS